MSTVAHPPVIRRAGVAALTIRINAERYSLRRRESAKGSYLWSLRKLTGERRGNLYAVSRIHGETACTCPDHAERGAVCKHIGALTAAGLVPGRKPSRKEVAR